MKNFDNRKNNGDLTYNNIVFKKYIFIKTLNEIDNHNGNE